MAAVIVATPGAANANSFGTLAEANSYHETQYHPDAPWEDLDDITKTQLLIMATQLMVNQIEWTGYTTSSTQALSWPRVDMMQRNEWSAVPTTDIPVEVKNATFELARILGYNDRTVESDIAANGITQLKAGPISMMFKINNNPGPAPIPISVTDMLVPSWFTTVRGQKVTTQELLRF